MKTIRRYTNRKLYLTNESRYVNLSEIEQMIRLNEEFNVIDAATNEDITGMTILQVIARNPMNSENVELMKQLIRDNSLQVV